MYNVIDLWSRSTHQCDLRVVVFQFVIVRLVAAPSAAVKTHDPPEKVGYSGTKTALFLHHFGGGGGGGSSVTGPRWWCRCTRQPLSGNNHRRRQHQQQLQPPPLPSPPPPLGRLLPRSILLSSSGPLSARGTDTTEKHVMTGRTSSE